MGPSSYARRDPQTSDSEHRFGVCAAGELANSTVSLGDVPRDDPGLAFRGGNPLATRRVIWLLSAYSGCSYFRQHISRPHAPEMRSGLSGRSWSFAIRMVTGSKSVRKVAQHRSRPQEPMPPCTRAESRAESCRSSTRQCRVAPRSRTSDAEVHPVRGGEVDGGALAADARRRRARGRRRPPSSAGRARGSAASRRPWPRPCGGAAPRRDAGRRRRPGRPAGGSRRSPRSTHCAAQTHSATSGPSSVGTSTRSPTCGTQLARVEVVEPAVPVEADRAEHAHPPTLRRVTARRAQRPATPRCHP